MSNFTVFSEELKQKCLTTFHEIPLIVVRVDTLPKNAPIELEMMAIANKSDYQAVFTPEGLTLKTVEGQKTVY